MSLLIGFLTFILVVTCLLLMLLVLIQLPKKEAGAGVAFGGAATDALFGAGSGTALTKMTKYVASLFVVLSLGLSMLNVYRVNRSERSLEEELRRQSRSQSGAPVLPGLPGTNQVVPVRMPMNQPAAAPAAADTNAPVTLPVTNLLQTPALPVEPAAEPAPTPVPETSAPPSGTTPAEPAPPAQPQP